ncbi:MAG: hypothetical protein ACUVQM_06780 [Candidatus Hadarchaeaceae archaeon]
MRRISLLLVAVSIVAVLVASAWAAWSQADRGKYITLRGEFLALSVEGSPMRYYLRAETVDSLIRLELENVGTFDVGSCIGRQVEITGYLYEEASQGQWMDVRILKPIPEY